jgi:hypothetical protein
VKETLLEKLAPEARAMIKEAFVGALAKMGLRAGKVLVKNPWKSLGAAGTGWEIASSAKGMGDLATGAKNMARTMPANM